MPGAVASNRVLAAMAISSGRVISDRADQSRRRVPPVGHDALRSIVARCSSVVPPQMPHGSSQSSAFCKHCRFTGHTAHNAKAASTSLRGVLFPGWKQSGSIGCVTQSARRTHRSGTRVVTSSPTATSQCLSSSSHQNRCSQASASGRPSSVFWRGLLAARRQRPGALRSVAVSRAPAVPATPAPGARDAASMKASPRKDCRLWRKRGGLAPVPQ